MLRSADSHSTKLGLRFRLSSLSVWLSLSTLRKQRGCRIGKCGSPFGMCGKVTLIFEEIRVGRPVDGYGELSVIGGSELAFRESEGDAVLVYVPDEIAAVHLGFDR